MVLKLLKQRKRINDLNSFGSTNIDFIIEKTFKCHFIHFFCNLINKLYTVIHRLFHFFHRYSSIINGCTISGKIARTIYYLNELHCCNRLEMNGAQLYRFSAKQKSVGSGAAYRRQRGIHDRAQPEKLQSDE